MLEISDRLTVRSYSRQVTYNACVFFFFLFSDTMNVLSLAGKSVRRVGEADWNAYGQPAFN